MKTNAYTVAIDHIHVSQSAIEAALAAAQLRASKTASSQAKVRYAAIAASVVLAGAASAAYFGSIAGFDPPTKPSPGVTSSIGSTEAVKETEHTKGTESKSMAEAATAPAPAETTEQAQSVVETRESATDTDGMEAPAPTDSTAAITETSVPDSMITPSEPSKPTPTEASPLPEVDSSQLCADGKLFIALAQTGLSQIDDPDAFSDDHLYYIETKFGRYYKIHPPKLSPPVPSWIDQPKSDQTVYLYNSDGEILSEVPIWW